MIKKIITICLVPCVMFICISMWGCGKEDEQVSPESTTVKSFRIDKKKESADNSGAKEGSDIRSALSEGVDTKDSLENSKTSEPDSNKTSGKNADSGKTTPSDSVSETGNNKNPKASPALALTGDGEKSANETIYNPEGQINPFEPLFKGKEEKTDTSGTRAQTIRGSRIGKLTPLEKMDISQLKLTAIILGQKNIAMVQEATGKGHVIKKGTYIGINSGRVVEITKNTVVIEEEVEDLLGKIIVRKRELKLQKPLGEM